MLVGGVAIVGWFRPLPTNKPPAAPTYTEQQAAEAKVKVCGAFEKVAHALDIAAARTGGNDPISILAVATSARQVFDVGSGYLVTKLAEEPATPPDLAKAVRKLANSYQELTVDYLDGLTNSDTDLQPSLRAGDEAASTINGLCK